MNSKQSLKIFETKKAKIRAGEIVSVNDSIAKGHKGRVSKKQKNNIVELVIITHASKTRGMQNIKLQENPDPNDKTDAYVLKRKHKTKNNKLGKRHPGIKINNPIDKSVFRKIGNTK